MIVLYQQTFVCLLIALICMKFLVRFGGGRSIMSAW